MCEGSTISGGSWFLPKEPKIKEEDNTSIDISNLPMCLSAQEVMEEREECGTNDDELIHGDYESEVEEGASSGQDIIGGNNHGEDYRNGKFKRGVKLDNINLISQKNGKK